MIREEIFLGITCLHHYSLTLVAVPCCSHLCKTLCLSLRYMEIRVACLLQSVSVAYRRESESTLKLVLILQFNRNKTALLRLLFEPWPLPFCASKSPEASVSKSKVMLSGIKVQCKWCHGYRGWGVIFVAVSPSWKCPIKPERKWDLFYRFLEHYNSILAILLSVRSFFFFNSIKLYHYVIWVAKYSDYVSWT